MEMYKSKESPSRDQPSEVQGCGFDDYDDRERMDKDGTREDKMDAAAAEKDFYNLSDGRKVGEDRMSVSMQMRDESGEYSDKKSDEDRMVRKIDKEEFPKDSVPLSKDRKRGESDEMELQQQGEETFSMMAALGGPSSSHARRATYSDERTLGETESIKVGTQESHDFIGDNQSNSSSVVFKSSVGININDSLSDSSRYSTDGRIPSKKRGANEGNMLSRLDKFKTRKFDSYKSEPRSKSKSHNEKENISVKNYKINDGDKVSTEAGFGDRSKSGDVLIFRDKSHSSEVNSKCSPDIGTRRRISRNDKPVILDDVEESSPATMGGEDIDPLRNVMTVMSGCSSEDDTSLQRRFKKKGGHTSDNNNSSSKINVSQEQRFIRGDKEYNNEIGRAHV